ncbi:MAG TPA: type IV pilus secretin PilQ [Thermoanaerobaculia bacterium]
MRRAKRILLVASMLLLSVSAADARTWGRKAADKAAKPVPLTSPVALMSVEIDGSRVLLRTSGAPAYTSYSTSPGVFVVDLTGTTREPSLAIPSSLPSVLTGISAAEVVEMGNQLTRVTFRFSEAIQPEVSALQETVVVELPVRSIPIEAVDVIAPVTELAGEAVAVYEEPIVTELPAESPAVASVEPVRATYEVALPPARTVRSVGVSKETGNIEVRITGDGKLTYKAFRLEAPSRLVIDLQGVRNASPTSSVPVSDPIVQKVRIAQFQPTVARVVVDLAGRTDYDIAAVGDQVRVAFGSNAVATRAIPPAAAPVAVAAYEPPQPRPLEAVQPIRREPAPVSTPRTTDVVAQVPIVAENASSWKMPAASAGARPVINSPLDQAPVQRPVVQEDVFGEAAPSRTAPQTLSGRTLSGGARVFTGEPLSLNLKDADIRDVLSVFAELTGLNMAIDPDVTGTVNVNFVDVPWDQALDVILRQNGLTYTLEGNVMRIGRMQRIAAEAAATRTLAEEERLNVPLTTLGFKLSYARAPEVQALLREIASPRARIIVDQRTNQLIVSEVPEYLRTMQNLIATIDIPTRQVMIEARIVESSRTFSQQWGFEWGFGGDLDPSLGSGTGLVFPNRIGYSGGPFEFGSGGRPILSLSLFDVLGTFNLDLALLAAEAQGYIKVVSAPRVTTQDNQAAEIQSGFQIPYQTRVNFTTTVQYLDATLRLTVTPQITEAGTVIMEIAVQKNEPASGLAIEGAAGTPLTTRQARTRLMVRDGGTAVIAGIFQTRDNDSETRVPFVHNIPLIGALFRSHNISTSHDELLIFITPRIVRG